jgi:hypothetical protein
VTNKGCLFELDTRKKGIDPLGQFLNAAQWRARAAPMAWQVDSKHSKSMMTKPTRLQIPAGMIELRTM